MENLDANCLADVYGENLEDIPEWIKADIVDILYMLYMHVGIEYVDVTPYNFVEKDGIVWVVDFGHAREADYDKPDDFLDDTFASWELQKWNCDYA
jgi:RIO-like serine/threonine protein kinase